MYVLWVFSFRLYVVKYVDDCLGISVSYEELNVVLGFEEIGLSFFVDSVKELVIENLNFILFSEIDENCNRMLKIEFEKLWVIIKFFGLEESYSRFGK